MDKFRFRVVGIDIDHNLTRYPEGSTIELTLDAASERRRWLELIGPVEDDNRPTTPAAPTLPEPPIFTSAAFVSGPTGAVTTSQEQPPTPPGKAVEELPTDKSVAKPAAKKPAEKGVSK